MQGNYKGYPDPSLIVSVDEAKTLLDKSDVVFVDTRNYWKYVEEHIPGAFNLELYAFHWVDTSREGIEVFVRQMARLVGSLGIDSSKQVIFYQNNSGYDAARGVWLLHFLGHKRARILDGGLNLWRRKKLPLSTSDPPAPKQGRFKPRLELSTFASMDSLSKLVTKGESQILDCRSAGEYSGKFRRAIKLGHIPWSLNIEWKSALRKDGTLKDARQLQKLYGNIKKEGETVTYCQSGYRAAHSWLVLRLLGFQNVKNYLGSWYEWGNEAGARVVST
ncbi:MAG: sulfurtransferase [Nitrososphaerota archaeon]|nr:sulfurtransferase [Nitrososphaerota archaeon]